MVRLVERVKRALYHECEHQVCAIWRSPSEHLEQWYMETGGYEPCTEEIAYCPYCGAYLPYCGAYVWRRVAMSRVRRR